LNWNWKKIVHVYCNKLTQIFFKLWTMIFFFVML
jgi:hypothetical protein